MRNPTARAIACAGVLACALLAPPRVSAQRGDSLAPAELAGLDLADLARIPLAADGTGGRPVMDGAAATTVLSREDIRRSGAVSLPDLLRFVPGLQVARAGSREWVVGAREVHGGTANRLLVLVDGRSVNSPLDGGAAWDLLLPALEDVDRIEVIRGAAAALRGGRAVAGVVDIRTRPAVETDGGITLATGTRERARASVRHAGTFGAGLAYRFSAGADDRQPSALPDGVEAIDDWRAGQAGFRVDGPPGIERWSVEAAIHGGNGDTRLLLPLPAEPYAAVEDAEHDVRGVNVAAHWWRELGGGSDVAVRLGFRRVRRTETPLYGTHVEGVVDAGLAYRMRGPGGSDLRWGAEVELVNDEVTGAPAVRLFPERRATHRIAAFARDVRPLAGNRLLLSLGAALEHNGLSGAEFLPEMRLTWTPGAIHQFWGVVSRTVRVPTRLDRDGTAVGAELNEPVEQRLLPGGELESESLLNLESGYRLTPGRGFSVDLALFDTEYRRLQSLEDGAVDDSGPRAVRPLSLGNAARGRSWGGEVAMAARPLPGWRLRAAYGFLRSRIESEADAGTGSVPRALAGIHPEHQASLRSAMDLPGNVELDVALRYVGALAGLGVPNYLTGDVRLGWRWRRRLDLAVVGNDLFAPAHREFPAGPYGADDRLIERRGHVELTWHF